MNPASNAAFAPDELAPASAQATGSLADAALPGASFTSDDFAVELSQTSLAEADEILKATLEEAMQVVGGNRAFLALVEVTTGETSLRVLSPALGKRCGRIYQPPCRRAFPSA